MFSATVLINIFKKKERKKERSVDVQARVDRRTDGSGRQMGESDLKAGKTHHHHLSSKKIYILSFPKPFVIH